MAFQPYVPKSFHNPPQPTKVRPVTPVPHDRVSNSVPVTFFLCCDKSPWPKISLEERVSFCLYFQATVHHWGKSGQKPGSRSWCRGHGGALLTGLLLMACSACFLIPSRTTFRGVAPPSMAGFPPPPCQSLIKKTPHRLASSQSGGSIFSIEFLSSQTTVACANLTKPTRTTWKTGKLSPMKWQLSHNYIPTLILSSFIITQEYNHSENI